LYGKKWRCGLKVGAVRPLTRHDDDDPFARDAAQFGDRRPQVLHVFQGVCRDDGFECTVPERQLLDVTVAPTHVGVRAASTGGDRDVATDDVVIRSEAIADQSEPTGDVQHTLASSRLQHPSE
jgi:hypothetical protein